MIQVGVTSGARKKVEETIKEKGYSCAMVEDGGDSGFSIFKVDIEFGGDAVAFMAAGASFCTRID